MNEDDKLAEILGMSESAKPRSAVWGKVSAVNDSTITAIVGADANGLVNSVNAVKCCNASVGDVVAIDVVNGRARAIARRGGESWDSIGGKPSFAMVATTGSYNDLTNKPVSVSGKWATAYNLASAFSMPQSSNGTDVAALSFSQLTGNDNEITLSSGSLRCPYEGTVIAFAQVALGTSGFTANDILHLRIQRSGANTGADMIERKVSTGYGTMQLITVVSVVAGDVISAKAWNQTAARGSVQANASTRLTVAYM